MNDKNQLVAMCAGIAALLLVVVLAFNVLPGSKRSESMVSYPPMAAPSSEMAKPPSDSSDSIQNAVKTPDSNSIKESVTVKAKK